MSGAEAQLPQTAISLHHNLRLLDAHSELSTQQSVNVEQGEGATSRQKKRQLAAQLEGRQSPFSDELLVGSLQLLRVDDRAHDFVPYVNEDFESEYWDNRYWPKHWRHLKKQPNAMPVNEIPQETIATSASSLVQPLMQGSPSNIVCKLNVDEATCQAIAKQSTNTLPTQSYCL